MPWDIRAMLGADLDPGGGGGDAEPPPPDPDDESPSQPPPDPGDALPRPPEPGDATPPPGNTGEEPTETISIYAWVTAADARVCPICGPLDGTEWEGDDGLYPPLHMGCRCRRVLVRTATRVLRRRRVEETVETIDRPPSRPWDDADPPRDNKAHRRF